MRSSIIGLAIGAALQASATEGGDLSGATPKGQMIEVTGKDLDGKEIKEGTMIPASMVANASQMVESFWGIEEQRRTASKQVLELAAQAVRDAQGSYKLALTYFTGAVASAVSDFRKAHKGDSKEERAKIEEFLAKDGSLFQYVSNIGMALKEGFQIVKETNKDPQKWPLKYPTEHSLRVARKAAKDLKNHARSAVQTLSDRLDTSDLTETQIKEAQANALQAVGANASEADVKAAVEKELVKLGAVEMEEEEGEETEAEQDRAANKVHSLSEQWATRVLGEQPAYAKGREALAKLIRLSAQVDLDQHLDEFSQAIENASTKLVALIRKESIAKGTGKTEAKGPQVSVGP